MALRMKRVGAAAWLVLSVLMAADRLRAAAAGADELQARSPRRPLRMLVDEYHHFPRPADYSQGFSLRAEDAERTYYYSSDGSAYSNGLFFFQHIVSDDFDVAVSGEPIGGDLSSKTEAFMLICPETAAAGNPHPITEADADHLEAFVRQGGILILVFNSFEPQPSGGGKAQTLDRDGINRIARRFGLEFLAAVTRTLGIPIRRDHPVLFGVRGVIYGNGDTIRVRPKPGAEATVLLESTNPEIPGPIAVRVRYGRGAVLALGDAGTLGNGHFARDDVGQSDAVARLFHCLLPEGPLPTYGWKEGTALRVRLRHELALETYPEALGFLEAPLAPAVRTLIRQPRALDLLSAGESAVKQPIDEHALAQRARMRRMQLSRGNWDVSAQLRVGAHDGRAFAAQWVGADGKSFHCRLTHRGEFLDSAPGAKSLDNWRWALLNEVIIAPIDPHARPGDAWRSPALAALPNVRLEPAATTRAATGCFRFAGAATLDGHDCFVLTKTTDTPLDDLRPQSLIDSRHADLIDQSRVRLRAGRQISRTQTWIDRHTRLPRKTVLQSSAVLWLSNRAEPDPFVSDHDYEVHEFRTDSAHVLVIGRLLAAEFE